LKLELNGNGFETAKCNIQFNNSEAVKITDAEKVLSFLEANGRDECIRHAPAEINKKELGDLLRQGVQIDGAEIENRLNINIK
jgi:phage host-nuclease inhibitor protein Gam